MTVTGLPVGVAGPRIRSGCRSRSGKSLVDKVREEEKGQHLDPVREVVEWQLPRASVERELLEEIAGSLARAVQKVDVAIAKVEALAALADRSAADLDAFEGARRAALAARRDLSIHREALHLPHDPRFESRYPIPPSRRFAR